MKMANLATINDDCLWAILSYCDLMTQLDVSKVCKRLKFVVQDLFNKKFKILKLDCTGWNEECTEQLSININGEKCDLSVKDLQYFIELTHALVKEFHIKVPKIFVNPTERFHFPNVKTLCFQSYNEKPLQSLEEIHECFPNLRSLTLNGFFNLNFSTRYQSLESLDVTFCIGVTVDSFLKMISLYELRNLRVGNLYGQLTTLNGDLSYLSKLEALHVSSKEAQIFVEALGRMNSLKELFVSDLKTPAVVARINRTLSELEDRRVSELTVSKFFEYLNGADYLTELAEQVQRFTHLRKLAIVGYHAGFSNILNAASFPALEELVFYLSHTNIEFMVNTMKDNPKLKTIDFIDCFSESETVALDVESITKTRREHLSINIHRLKDDADFMPADVYLKGESDLITLTYKPPSTTPLRYVAMQYVIEQVQ